MQLVSPRGSQWGKGGTSTAGFAGGEVRVVEQLLCKVANGSRVIAAANDFQLLRNLLTKRPHEFGSELLVLGENRGLVLKLPYGLLGGADAKLLHDERDRSCQEDDDECRRHRSSKGSSSWSGCGFTFSCFSTVTGSVPSHPSMVAAPPVFAAFVEERIPTAVSAATTAWTTSWSREVSPWSAAETAVPTAAKMPTRVSAPRRVASQGIHAVSCLRARFTRNTVAAATVKMGPTAPGRFQSCPRSSKMVVGSKRSMVTPCENVSPENALDVFTLSSLARKAPSPYDSGASGRTARRSGCTHH